MFPDPRTWSTLLYQLLMLPLGIFNFTLAVTALALSFAVAVAPIVQFWTDRGAVWVDGIEYFIPLWATPATFALGVLMLLGTMHLARGIGVVHGHLAKQLLVKIA